MVYSFNDIKCKEVINIKSGCRLGYPDDLEFESCTAKICKLIIFGKPRFFGLLGRDEDLYINWSDIEVIGEDTILVSCDCPSNSPSKHGKGLSGLFK